MESFSISRCKHNGNEEDDYDAEKRMWRHRSTGPGHFAALTVLICIIATIFFGGAVVLLTSENVGRGLMCKFGGKPLGLWLFRQADSGQPHSHHMTSRRDRPASLISGLPEHFYL